MKHLVIISIFIAIYGISLAQTGNLTVNINTIESNEGNIKIAVYNTEGSSGFLKTIDTAFDKKIAAIKNGKASALFSNLPYGTYAVAVFQDKNNNNIFDRAPIGLPLEPWGVSENPKTIGPPGFNDSKFEFGPEKKQITIYMKEFKLN